MRRQVRLPPEADSSVQRSGGSGGFRFLPATNGSIRRSDSQGSQPRLFRRGPFVPPPIMCSVRFTGGGRGIGHAPGPALAEFDLRRPLGRKQVSIQKSIPISSEILATPSWGSRFFVTSWVANCQTTCRRRPSRRSTGRASTFANFGIRSPGAPG